MIDDQSPPGAWKAHLEKMPNAVQSYQIVLPWPPASLSGHNSGHWSSEEIGALKSAYADGWSVSDISEVSGRTRGAIRNKAYALGITVRDDSWKPSEIDAIRSAYSGDPKRGDLNLRALAAQIGRSQSSICRKAKELGLTDNARKGNPKPKTSRAKYKSEQERSAARSASMKLRHKNSAHPMKGKRHSDAVREKIAIKARQAWSSKTEQERADWTTARMKATLEKHGTLTHSQRGGKASWKAGWREIGGKRNYYRSRWEANYARYLEFLKANGSIQEWQHEPETFWFDGIKRGVRSYLPDFRVWESDGSTVLHEVKGWMDARSKTTLRRMAKYHPQEKIIVIREKQYREIALKVGGLIDGWESKDASGGRV